MSRRATKKLTPDEFYAVRRALLAGMRHAEIARELNLSLWTITRVADGLRFVTDLVTDEQLPVLDAPPDYLAKNLRRCPGCGAMIYLSPCIACQLATMTQRVPPAPEVDDALDDMDDLCEVKLAPCGRRRRTKRTNVAYRAKMARQGRDVSRQAEALSHG